jgi:hypothetical protein
MINLSRYDRRYAALWLPLVGVMQAGFVLLAVFVIGVMLMAGFGLAGSTLNAWSHFGFRPSSVPHLLIGLAFAPMLALVTGLLVIGGVMMVLVRIIAFETKRRPGGDRPRHAPTASATSRFAERVLWTRPVEPTPGTPEPFEREFTVRAGGQDDDALTRG